MVAAWPLPSTFDNRRSRISPVLVECQGVGDEWATQLTFGPAGASHDSPTVGPGHAKAAPRPAPALYYGTGGSPLEWFLVIGCGPDCFLWAYFSSVPRRRHKRLFATTRS